MAKNDRAELAAVGNDTTVAITETASTLPDGYWAYHELVIAEVRKQLVATWKPRTFKERDSLAMALRFFDVDCTYDEEFARGDDPAEVAEGNIEAADWE